MRTRHRRRTQQPTRRRLHLEPLEDRRLLAADWHNDDNGLDVLLDGQVLPSDVLAGINELNLRTLVRNDGTLPDRRAFPGRPLYDVNNDTLLTPADVLTVINALNGEIAPPQIQLGLARDTAPHGGTNSDHLTYDPTVVGSVSGVLGVSSLRGRVDDQEFVEIPLETDGRFRWMPELATDGSVDGTHVITLSATDGRQQASEATLAFMLDTQPPDLLVSSPRDGDRIVVGDRLQGAVGATAVRLVYEFDGQSAEIAFDPATGAFDELLPVVPEGIIQLDVRAEDEAGNSRRSSQLLEAQRPPHIRSVLPHNGSNEVGVTFRPLIHFSEPIDVNSLNADNFYVGRGGERLAARIVPSETAMFAWLFPDAAMPAASTLTLHVRGDTIFAADDGMPLDADRDGVPGGSLAVDFTTVSLSPVPATRLAGLIVDPGPDRLPFTADDVDPGPDQKYRTDDDIHLLPLENVAIHIIGLESAGVVTAADGRFTLDSVPSGNVKLVVDGLTATEVPDGIYFPEMVMDVTVSAGGVNQAMPDSDVVYLPRLRTALLADVDPTQTTHIVTDPEDAPELTTEQAQRLTIDIPPDSLIGGAGQKLDLGQVGISTVPPELVRDMLPPGILQHTFDITVQAPGIVNFSTPAPMTFPNVFDAAPGEELSFLSFDHTTGRLVIEGSATVSGDGLQVTTNPGTGVTHPGWHGLAPPGNDSGGCNPATPPSVVVKAKPVFGPFQHYFFPSDDGEVFLAVGNAAELLVPELDPCHPANVQATPMLARLSIEGPVTDFLDGPLLSEINWTLYPGQQASVKYDVRDLIPAIAADVEEVADVFYGAALRLEVFDVINAVTPVVEETIYVYRYLDASDSSATDQLLEFAPTLNDGTGNVQRRRPFDLRMPPSVVPSVQLSQPSHFAFDTSGQPSWVFDPTANTPTFHSKPPLDTMASVMTPSGAVAGTFDLQGASFPKQAMYVNQDGLVDALDAIALFKVLPGLVDPTHVNRFLLTDSELASFDTASERKGIAVHVEAELTGRFSAVADGIEFLAGSTPTVSDVAWMTTPEDGFFGKSPAPPVGDGIDNLDLLEKLFGELGKHSAAQQNFLLAEALNRGYKPTVHVFVDSHFEDITEAPLKITSAQFAESLATTLAHEWAHAMGVLHTAQLGLTVDTNEIQLVQLAGAVPGETFTLTFDGHTTQPIPVTATAVQVRSALANLLSIGSLGRVAVTGVDGTFEVSFIGDFSGGNVPEMTGSGSGSTVVTVTTTADGNVFVGPKVGAPEGDPQEVILDGVLGRDDIMAGGRLDIEGKAAFQSGLSLDALRVALKLDWSFEEARNTVDYYLQNFTHDSGAFSRRDGRDYDELVIDGPRLALTGTGGRLIDPVIDLGNVIADGQGSAVASQDIVLNNIGNQTLLLNQVDVRGGNGQFSLTDVAPGTEIPAGGSLSVQLTVDAAQSGYLEAVLHIDSNDPVRPADMAVRAEGVSPDADLRLAVDNNNLGGVDVGSVQVRDSLITLSNAGQQQLIVTDVQAFTGARADMQVTGLPANFGADDPLILEPGQSLALGVEITVSEAGLIPLHIQFTSNDPDQPVARQPLVATGTDPEVGFRQDRGYVALKATGAAASDVLRTITDEGGNWSFFLAPETFYQQSLFDPESGLIAHSFAQTPTSGVPYLMPAGVPVPSTAPDRDGDGLPDDIEFAVGSSVSSRDTDGDGLGDYEELKQGFDPRGDEDFTSGIIGALDLAEPIQDLVVIRSSDSGQPTLALAATGVGGVEVIDVSQPNSPRRVAQLPSVGATLRIAADPAVGRAVVAGPSELHVLDISGVQPRLLESLPISADDIEIIGRTAFVVANEQEAGVSQGLLLAVDLASGSVARQVTYPDVALNALAREANRFYFTASDDTLRIAEWSAGQFQKRGELAMSDARGELAVGAGVAYVMAADAAVGGFATVDVSNADQPILISGPDTPPPNALPRTAIALDGNERAVLVGMAAGVGGEAPDITIIDVSDPDDTAEFLTRFPIDALPLSVTVAGGLAFVGDSAGLKVVRFAGVDTAGIAPTAELTVLAADTDLDRSGLQVSEFESLTFLVTAADDYQVVEVELLLDGRVAATSLSFPFHAAIPAPKAGPSLRSHSLQVRVTDSGGNIGISNQVFVEVNPDTTPPALISLNPADRELKPRGFNTVEFQFSESLAPATVTGESFRVLDSRGDPLIPKSIRLDESGTRVTLEFADFEPGDYGVRINAAFVTDLAGLPLGDETIGSSFSVDQFSLRFDAEFSNDFLDPRNWDQDRLPSAEDYLLIDVDLPVPVLFSGSEHPDSPVTVTGLTVKHHFRMSLGVQLTVLGELQLEDWLDFAGATLREATLIPTGLSRVTADCVFSLFGGAAWDNVTVAGDLDLSESCIDVQGPIRLNGRFTGPRFSVEGGFRTFLSGEAVIVDGQIDVLADSALTVGRGISMRGESVFQVARGGVLTTGGRIITEGDGQRSYAFLELNDHQSDVPALWLNDGTIVTRDGAEMMFAGTRDELAVNFINRGVLRSEAGGALQFRNLKWMSADTVVEAGGRMLMSGTLTTQPGKTSTLRGAGEWLVNGGPQFKLGRVTYVEPSPNRAMLEGGTVELVEGAKLKGSLALRDVHVRGDLELTQVYDNSSLFSPPPFNGDEIILLGDRVIIDGHWTLGDERTNFGVQVVAAGRNVALDGIAQMRYLSPQDNHFGTVERSSDLVIGEGIAVTAPQLTLGPFANASSTSITNHGALVVTGGNLTTAGRWYNPGGIIAAHNATTFLGGSFPTSAVGGFVRTGGQVHLSGALLNDQQILELNGATGDWLLSGGLILGGTFVSTDGARLIATDTGGLFDELRLAGDVDLTTNDGAFIRVTDGLELTTTLRIGSQRTFGQLRFEGQQALQGTGTVVLAGNDSRNALLVPFGLGRLTIADSITIQGHGTIGQQLEFGGADNITVNNGGLIHANEAGVPLVIRAQDWTTDGELHASGGGQLQVFGQSPTNPGSQEYASSWLASTVGAARTRVASRGGPQSDGFFMRMDTLEDRNSLNEWTLTFHPGDAAEFGLRFRHASFGDAGDSLPASFVGSAEGDGVSISGDGTTWYRVVDLSPATEAGVYETIFVDLATAAASVGISLGDGFHVRFQQYSSVASAGRAFEQLLIGPGLEP